MSAASTIGRILGVTVAYGATTGLGNAVGDAVTELSGEAALGDIADIATKVIAATGVGATLNRILGDRWNVLGNLLTAGGAGLAEHSELIDHQIEENLQDILADLSEEELDALEMALLGIDTGFDIAAALEQNPEIFEQYFNDPNMSFADLVDQVPAFGDLNPDYYDEIDTTLRDMQENITVFNELEQGNITLDEALTLDTDNDLTETLQLLNELKSQLEGGTITQNEYEAAVSALGGEFIFRDFVEGLELDMDATNTLIDAAKADGTISQDELAEIYHQFTKDNLDTLRDVVAPEQTQEQVIDANVEAFANLTAPLIEVPAGATVGSIVAEAVDRAIERKKAASASI